MASKTEAYIALLSLLNTLMQILHPPRHWLHLNQEQMHRLLNKVRFLVDFLEDEDNFMEIDGLETQMMASTAYSAEDSLESYVLHLNLARSTKTTGSSVDRFIGKVKKMINETVTTSLKGSSSLNPLPAVSSVISTGSFSLHIQKIIEEFDHIISNVMKIKETTFRSSKDLSSSLNPDLPAVSSSLAPNRQSTLVGLDHKVIDVMNMLDEPQPERQILSIVGMGGIGAKFR